MLRIRNWDKHYETSDTRKLVNLNWVKLPNQHDTLEYRLISKHERGAEIFAAWVLMVQVASRAKRDSRGFLPYTPEDLSIITGFPADIFAMAIEFLKSPKISWIEQSPDNLPSSPDNLPESPDMSGKSPGRIEGNGMEEKEYSLVAERDESLREQFREAVKAYPTGKKRSAEIEWIDFLKKHGKRKAEIVPLLLPAIEGYKAYLIREKTEPKHIKHFQGWISESRWTVDYGATQMHSNRPSYKTAAQIQAERGF